MTTLQDGGHAGGGAAEPRAWSYGPGEWYAVLSRDAAVLLPPGERDRVGRLWAAVDDGIDFDALLDALLADGLRVLAGFVLLSVEGAGVRVLARGDASIACETDDGPVLFDGRSAATWAERRLVGVRATRVVLGGAAVDAADRDEEAAPGCVLGTALVRVAWVAHPGLPTGAAPPLTEPERKTPDPLEPAPAPPAARETDHDGGTRAGGDLVARLILSTGEAVDVDRVVLLGRDPRARAPADAGREPGQRPGEPRLVRVPSPQHEISSTHLQVRPGRAADQGAAVATDLGSTNGTIVIQPGLPPEDLQPFVPVALAPGTVLDLGDGVSLEVAAP